VHDKYWAQRRRLFKKFDEGIELDAEGWYSVTPEVVADHVASRFKDASEHFKRSVTNNANGRNARRRKGQQSSKPMVILDAFCGCGGNAIAFAKLSPSVVSHIICIDVDRTKLRKAAHNASIYGIAPNRIIFVEANSVAVMERYYRDGILVMEPPEISSEYPPREIYDDFTIGGIDLLNEIGQRIDCIFMDPPW
jgi:trimethylguanosine synthase